MTIELDQIMAEIERFREQVGYYPTAGEWNAYAQAEGLLTSAEIWIRFQKRWFELIPEAKIEKEKRLHENRLKSPHVQETELGILAFIEERGRFPSVQEWNREAVSRGLLTVAELKKEAMNWWAIWSERYGGVQEAGTTSSAPLRKPAEGQEHGRVGRPRQSDPTIEDCIMALHKAAEKLGQSFLQKDYNEFARANGLPPFNKFAPLFRQHPKQWDAAMRAAGLMAEKPERDRFTREDAIRALKEAAQSLGESFTQQEYNRFAAGHDHLPHMMTIVKLFGEEESPWAAAMEAAGLKSKRSGKKKSGQGRTFNDSSESR